MEALAQRVHPLRKVFRARQGLLVPLEQQARWAPPERLGLSEPHQPCPLPRVHRAPNSVFRGFRLESVSAILRGFVASAYLLPLLCAPCCLPKE